MKLLRITWRRAMILAVLLLAAGLAAPYLRADHFGERIRSALEESLGRKVEIADVRFNLFPGPGFLVRKVVIHDDPAAGIEPLAYVSLLEARIRLRSLWTGRLEFASLRLVEPSVNLVKTDRAGWNFQPLLSRAASADLPEIRVRGGRLNFKFGDTKSVFYFSGADVDLVPLSGPQEAFELRFSGEPTRTDRASQQGFGRLTARGRWLPSREDDGRVELSLRLGRSSIGELIGLVHGHDIGLHGRIAGEARLSGPLSGLQLRGGLQLEDIHRWDLMPPYAEGGPLNFTGKLDMVGQHLEVETLASDKSTLVLRFRASSYLSDPRWAVSLTTNELPLAPVLDVARHVGIPLSEGAEMDGSITGVVGYSPEQGFQGRAVLSPSQVRLLGIPPLQIEEAQLLLDGSRLRVAPAVLLAAENERAQIQMDYDLDSRRIELRVSTESLSLASAKSRTAPLLGLSGLPLFKELRGGTWKGWLRYRGVGEARGEWSGELEVRDTEASIPGIDVPVTLASAKVGLLGGALNVHDMHGRIGEAELEGVYRYWPGEKRPHWFHCRVAEVDAVELESWLASSLRRPRGFLSRTLGRGRVPLPSWLQSRHVEGILEIGSLTLAERRFESVSARLFWDRADLNVTALDAKIEDGRVSGHMHVDVGGARPVYRLAAAFHRVPWLGGRLDGDGLLRTSGSGADLLLNLRAEGAFAAHSVELVPDLEFQEVTGCYELSWARQHPRLRLNCLRLTSGRTTFLGRGVTGEDGKLHIELTSLESKMRLAGSLTPLQLVATEYR